MFSRKPPTPTLKNPGAIGDLSADIYGRRPFCEALANLIDAADKGGPPVIAINGRYGTGKSSTLTILENELRLRSRHRIIWVNAWRVTGADQLLASILHGAALNIKSDWAGAWLGVLLSRSRRIALPVWFAIFFPLALLAALWIGIPSKLTSVKELLDGDVSKLAIPATISTIFAILTRAAKPLGSTLGSVINLQSADKVGLLTQFADEIEVYSAALNRNGRFILFIEDLDRCNSSRVLEVINAISQLAAHPSSRHFCFIIPFDYKDVREKLAQALKEEKEEVADARQRAEEHLRKILTIAVNLPKPKEHPPVGFSMLRVREYLLRMPLTALIDAVALSSLVSAALVWLYSGKITPFPLPPTFVLLPVGAAFIARSARWLSIERNPKAIPVTIAPADLAAFRKLLPDNLRERIVIENYGIAALKLRSIYEVSAAITTWQLLSAVAFVAQHRQALRATEISVAPLSFREGGDQFLDRWQELQHPLSHCRDPKVILALKSMFAPFSEWIEMPLRLPQN